MRKSIAALLSALTVFGVTGTSVSCKKPTDTADKVLFVNEFENYDEIREVAPARVQGKVSVNADGKYITQGNASMKFDIVRPSAAASNGWWNSQFNTGNVSSDITPALSFSSENEYNDLSKIRNFSIDVYNAEESTCKLVFVARDSNGEALYFNSAELLAGKLNAVKFDVNGSFYKEKTVATKYEVAFYGIRKGTFYLDNFRVTVKGSETTSKISGDSSSILDFNSSEQLGLINGYANTYLPTVFYDYNQNPDYAKDGSSLKLDKIGVSGKEHKSSVSASDNCVAGNGFSIYEDYLLSLNIPNDAKIVADVFVVGEKSETVNVFVGDGVKNVAGAFEVGVGEWKTVTLEVGGKVDAVKILRFTVNTLNCERESRIYLDNIRFEV